MLPDGRGALARGHQCGLEARGHLRYTSTHAAVAHIAIGGSVTVRGNGDEWRSQLFDFFATRRSG